MRGRFDVDREVSAGAQPTFEDLTSLREEGFRSIVNLRAMGEPGMPLDPIEEERRVHELGMEYLHFPVEIDSLSPELVDRFRERLADLPGPRLVHCGGGRRSGALALADRAVALGLSGEETILQARAMGLLLDTDLATFVRDYVDAHVRA